MTTLSTPSLSAALIRDFENETALTRRLCETAPEDRYDWKPHEKSMTLGALVGHLAEAASWLDSITEGDSMDFAQLTDYQPFVPTSKTELLATLDENAANFRKLLDGRSDEELRSVWTMRMGDKVLMQQPREEIVRSILIHHVAHHRGQLTVYLRMLDVPVPATYGSTADETTF